MDHEVDIVYRVNKRNELCKDHASYVMEEVLNSMKTWWRIHKEEYKNVYEVRTDTGILEVL